MCPSCQTDLTLFDLPGGPQEPVDVPVKDGRSIDEILASIMDGKEDHREIIESLKSVARNTPESGETEAAPASTSATSVARELGEKFLCPVCETLVAADATVCPGCGAEFSEGESTEYECPVCKASVPADADQCPNCGVRFADDTGTTPAAPPAKNPVRATSELAVGTRTLAPTSVAEGAPSAKPSRSPLKNRLDQLRLSRKNAERRIPSGDRKLLYRELPKLVNEVKPLLVSAKRIGLDIEDGKRIINDAIQAGKGRDIERAVALIADARRALDIAFVDFIGGGIERFIEEIRAAKGEPGVNAVTPELLEAVGRMEAGDYDGTWDLFQGVLNRFESEAKDYHEARKTIEDGDRLVQEVRTMGMDIRNSERMLRQARESLERRDVAGATRIGKQAYDRLKREVPDLVQEEMRKARSQLLDLKLKGNDLAKPIGILKEASAFVKQEEWAEALRQIRSFYKEIERIE